MYDVVMFIRLPRLVLAVAVGMCLSVSGVVMQAVVKNPLAETYVMGISSGASLGAMLANVSGLGRTVLSAVHDLNIAALYCDRLYMMKAGRIAAAGAPREVLTKAIIRDIYEVDAEMLEEKGIPWVDGTH